MRYRDLTRLLVKTAGLVTLVLALSQLPMALASVLYAASEKHGQGQIFLSGLIAMTLAPVAISLVAGLWMFVFAGSVTDRVLLERPASGVPTHLTQDIEAMITALLGLYFLIEGLKDAAHFIGRYWLQQYYAGGTAIRFTAMDIGGIAATGVGLIAGLILVTRGRGIAIFLRRLSGASVVTDDDPRIQQMPD